jgi:hypothetical protein
MASPALEWVTQFPPDGKTVYAKPSMSVNVVAARTAHAALSDQAYVKKIASLNANDRQEFYNQANARMLLPRFRDELCSVECWQVWPDGGVAECQWRAGGRIFRRSKSTFVFLLACRTRCTLLARGMPACRIT